MSSAAPVETPLLSLHIGRARVFGPKGEPSAIHKLPVHGPLRLTRLGLAGDDQADARHHGGPDKALHHYPREHYAAWRDALPEQAALFVPGGFGENLSTHSLREDNVCVGDVFKLGGAVAQISQGRKPHRLGRGAPDGPALRIPADLEATVRGPPAALEIAPRDDVDRAEELQLRLVQVEQAVVVMGERVRTVVEKGSLQSAQLVAGGGIVLPGRHHPPVGDGDLGIERRDLRRATDRDLDLAPGGGAIEGRTGGVPRRGGRRGDRHGRDESEAKSADRIRHTVTPSDQGKIGDGAGARDAGASEIADRDASSKRGRRGGRANGARRSPQS